MMKEIMNNHQVVLSVKDIFIYGSKRNHNMNDEVFLIPY